MVLLEMSASDRINATTTARQQLSKQLGLTYERQFVDINRGRSALAELCLTDVRPRAFAIVKRCRICSEKPATKRCLRIVNNRRQSRIVTYSGPSRGLPRRFSIMSRH